MKMTNDQMAVAIDALSEADETGRLGYAIARNLRKLKEESTEYIQIRDKAVMKYGETQDDGRMKVPPEKVADFVSEIQDIAQIEQDVDIYQVPEDVFMGGNLTSTQMEKLLFMVEEDD